MFGNLLDSSNVPATEENITAGINDIANGTVQPHSTRLARRFVNERKEYATENPNSDTHYRSSLSKA